MIVRRRGPARGSTLLAVASIALVLVAVAALAIVGHRAHPDPGGSDDAVLVVRVALFGGPSRTDGGMALSNSPEPGANVTLEDTRGHTWTSATGAVGTATLTVPAGAYTIDSTTCFVGPPRPLRLEAGDTTHYAIRCDVP